MRLLIEAKANPADRASTGVVAKVRRSLGSFKGLSGATPLHLAAQRGDLGTCRILLEAKAELIAKSSLGMTPLEHARFCRSGVYEGGSASSEVEKLLAS